MGMIPPAPTDDNGVRGVRRLYDARWRWDRSKENDEWPETKPGDDNGTSVRSAAEVLAQRGHVDWATSMEDDDVSERAP